MAKKVGTEFSHRVPAILVSAVTAISLPTGTQHLQRRLLTAFIENHYQLPDGDASEAFPVL
jgi:hypothetical protein